MNRAINEPPELQSIDYAGKVERIEVDGLKRTKDDFISRLVQPLFQAESYQEIRQAYFEVKYRLLKLNIFDKVDMMIDISKGPKASSNGFDVLIEVKEKRTINANASLEMGTNSANMVARGILLNTFGRGEHLSGSFTVTDPVNNGVWTEYGGFHIDLKKPLFGNPFYNLGIGFYKSSQGYPWSGYKELSKGPMINFTFPSILGLHILQWEGVWRDLRASSRTTSFDVREQSGHTLKSSLKHTLINDTRDSRALPKKGKLFKFMTEYAGLGGNIEFLKQDIEMQFNKRFAWDTVFQLSLAGGIIRSLDPNKEIKINDRFFLGGPLTLRGFNIKGAGPHINGNALGADTYWLCALHMYTPLPFRPGGFGELFKTHFFVNAGNLRNLELNKSMKENILNLSETYRLSAGVGVVLMMAHIARLELNYVIPVRSQQGDSVNPGFQFGIGVEFL